MNWMTRFYCWLHGHNLVTEKYEVKDTKKYHGHDEIRNYTGCRRCGAGNPEHELSYWKDDDKNLWERHETMAMLISIMGIMAAILIIATVVVGIGALAVLPINKYMCTVNGAEMDLASKYNYWTGCYFNVKGVWVADELLSVVDLLK